MGQDAGPVVRVRGLAKSYGAFQALGPVSFDIRPGATGLLGPNGAGKTTLIKTLLGLVDATTGDARVLGMDIRTERLAVRQAIGYMPERDAYIPNLSGVHFVAYAGQLAGLPASAAMQRAHEVLNYVSMDEERYRNVETYSTGMRQKVKLAQALVHDPKLLLLDEPTNGLDPKGRDEMLRLIRDIAHNRNISVVLSSHLLPDVEFVCPRVVVLNRGMVAAQGDLSKLQRAQGDAWSVRVKGDGTKFFDALKRKGAVITQAEGYHRVTAPAKATANSILEIAARTGVQVRHLAPHRSSLEDLFMDLVQEA